MGKITIEDLAKIREKTGYTMALRQGIGRIRITVHMGTCGIAAGARGILTAVMKEIESRNLKDVFVTNSDCAGTCGQEPMMTVEVVGEATSVKYVYLTAEKVKTIFETHVLKGQVVKELTQSAGNGKPH
jgi:NADP-reducing hydrogenase subunit HndB